MTAIERSTTGLATGIVLIAIPLTLWFLTMTGSTTGMNGFAMSTPEIPPPMDLPSMAISWTPRYALAMVGMWATMMLAMMMTSVCLPMVGLGCPPYPIILRFLSVYGAIWLCFSMLATTLQYALEQLGLLHPMHMWSMSARLSSALVLSAAIYQISPIKRRAQSACSFNKIATLTSVADCCRYGWSCLLCSTPLMLLMFVGGLMNLWWMVGLTFFVTLEKIEAQASWLRYTSAVSFLVIAWLIQVKA